MKRSSLYKILCVWLRIETKCNYHTVRIKLSSDRISKAIQFTIKPCSCHIFSVFCATLPYQRFYYHIVLLRHCLANSLYGHSTIHGHLSVLLAISSIITYSTLPHYYVSGNPYIFTHEDKRGYRS